MRKIKTPNIHCLQPVHFCLQSFNLFSVRNIWLITLFFIHQLLYSFRQFLHTTLLSCNLFIPKLLFFLKTWKLTLHKFDFGYLFPRSEYFFMMRKSFLSISTMASRLHKYLQNSIIPQNMIYFKRWDFN